MKNIKLALILLGVGTVGFLVSLFSYLSRAPLEPQHIAITALVLIIVPLSALIGLRNLKKQQAGLVVEDELSRRIKDQAAARSFTISLYMWLAIYLITLSSAREVGLPLLAGLAGMGGVFLVNWSLLNRQGVDHED